MPQRDPLGDAQRFHGMMPDKCDGHALHAGGLGGLYSGDGIFEHDALDRRNTQPVRCNLEHLRIGFAASGVFHGHDDGKHVTHFSEVENQIEIGPRTEFDAMARFQPAD